MESVPVVNNRVINILGIITSSLMKLDPSYQIDVKKRWFELVSSGKVQSDCVIVLHGIEEKIRYGLRLNEFGDISPFCIQEKTGLALLSPLSEAITEQHTEETWNIFKCPLSLRPILNYRKIYISTDISIVQVPSSEVQPLEKRVHRFSECSFCSGHSSLFHRDPLGTITCQSKRKWEIHWNIAPQDYAGHFLFIPQISLKSNQRPQFITKEDMEDVLEMIVHSPGVDNKDAAANGFIGYNSIGAGASQNHIHFQGYSSPTPLFLFPFLKEQPVLCIHEVQIYIRSSYHCLDCQCNVIQIQWNPKESHKNIIFVIHLLLESLAQCKVPFNVLFGSRSIFIFPRKYNVAQVPPYIGLGMLEFTGTFVYSNEAQKNEFTQSLLCNSLSSASLSREEVHKIINEVNILPTH